MGSLATLLGAISAVFLSMAILVRVDPGVARALDPLKEAEDPAGRNWLSILGRLGRSRWAGRSPGLLEERIRSAGFPWPPEVVRGLKVALPAALVAPMLLLATLYPGVALLALPVGAAASRAPDFVLARMARRRSAAIGGQAAELAEVLLATTQAGLTPPVAFRRSAEAVGGPLGHELNLATRQIGLGVPWRDAVGAFAARMDDPGVRRLTSTLLRTQRLGTSVVSSLRTVADDLRGERRAMAEERARRAPVKMMFPLVFLILPAFLLLTVGPVVLATIRSLG